MARVTFLRKLWMLLAAALLIAPATGPAQSLATDTAKPLPAPPLTGWVVDQAGLLPPKEAKRISDRLRDFHARKGASVAVLIVPTTAPEAIETYSLRVANTWKIGRAKVNDGLMFVVAVDDRRMRIEVGVGLEKAVTNEEASRIINESIRPFFRRDNFVGGIDAGLDRLFAEIDLFPLPPAEVERR